MSASDLIAAYLSISQFETSVELTKNKFNGLSLNESEDSYSLRKQKETESIFGTNEDQSNEIKKYLALTPSIESLKSTNDSLADRTYLVSNNITAADISVFQSLYPLMKSMSDEDRVKYNHFSRWFDLIQNSIPLETLSSFGLDPIKMNLVSKPSSLPIASEASTTEPNLRVGRIVKVDKHPDADSLYVEQIDVGEPEPRTVVSGLVNYIPIEEMQDRMVITVCNLKPAAMRGIKSYAMVLCASLPNPETGASSKVEFIEPPADAKPGDRASFAGFENIEPESLLNPKKKIWEAIQPGFITSDEFVAGWMDENKVHHVLNVNGSPCKCKSIAGGPMK
ncbi:hypothetical protein BB559_002996 [Furculomyces boomerangus]|uniref:tRNA-binding domain-containing protein n=1 Tax=Furculomyces boomerangus TaxID=61424 RepID=A0A2T9YQ65_9FUNG|nr:hypothetical protein BB559_002996 [Furculomyces boomerangus]